MLPRVLRTTAEGELKSQRCSAREVNKEIPGQWWLPAWGGPKFFLQWCKDAPDYVDEQHLRCLLEDLARYHPLDTSLPH